MVNADNDRVFDEYRDYPNKLLPVANEQKKPSYILVYVNTFLSASFAELFTFPLDVTKTRLHLQGEAAEKAGRGQAKRGMFSILYGMMRHEGFKGLYGGLSAMVIRNLVFNGPRVVMYDYLRRKLTHVDATGREVLPPYKSFLAGSFSGLTCQLVANPLDIVKIRMQMEGRQRALGYPVRVSGVAQALRTIYAQGGIRGLWHGVGPSCVRANFLTAGDTACYDISKRQFMALLGIEDGRLIQFLSSVSSGFAATILSTPTDVVKSRIMNQPVKDGKGVHYSGALDCFYKLITQEGFFAMYKGFMPCWLRIGPWSIFFWVAFEQLRRLQGDVGF